MQYILNEKFDGTFSINFIGEDVSYNYREIFEYDLSSPIKGIKSITNFQDTVRGTNSDHYFKIYFSYTNARSGVSWSTEQPITGITNLDVCSLNNFDLKIVYYRVDNVSNGTAPILSISNILIEGTYDINETENSFSLPSGDTFTIFKPKDIYKVFKLTGFELYGLNTQNLNIKFRFTQDNGRSYTQWEPLTIENVATTKLNPIRFAQVEYSVQNTGNNSSKLFDIILTGDFQNINANFLKTNRYGIKQDCAAAWISGATSDDNGTGPCLSGLTNGNIVKGCNPDITGRVYNYNMDWITKGLSCYMTGTNIYTGLNNANSDTTNQSGFWNPYNTPLIGAWYNQLATQSTSILGWTVDYYLRDPDVKGVDMTLHENQLFNVVDVQKIKIMVPNNQFPDNQVTINEFMLDMMDTFEVHILKDDFKIAFGIEKRPMQKDGIYFCQANRLFRVRHAQIFKDVMYMGVYYKVILEKFEQLANERYTNQVAKKLIEPLIKNTTIDELFGFDNQQDTNKTIKKQHRQLTKDPYRSIVNSNVNIVEKKIYNYGIDIAEYFYDFINITTPTTAVTYTFQDSVMSVSDNRAFTMWFNFNNLYNPNKIVDDDVFNSYHVSNNTYFELLNNYDDINKKGYKLWYSNKQISLLLNDDVYVLYATGLTTNVWYGIIVNINNRQRTIDLNLFKRDCDYVIKYFTNNYQNISLYSSDLTGITYYTTRGYKPVKNLEAVKDIKTSKLKLIYNFEYTNVNLSSFEIDQSIMLRASNIKYTNMRIFDDVIPDIEKSNVLNQNIIIDTNHLLLADNANRKLYTANIPNKLWE